MNTLDSQNFKTRDAASYDSVTEQFDYFTERLTSPLAEKLLSLAQIKPKEKIIDVGTGTGVVALRVAKMIDLSGKVYGIDLSDGMLAIAKKKAANLELDQKTVFIRMDAEELTFEDKSFDVVVSLFALLHFPDPLVALKEIYRVMRPGGRLILAIGSGVPIFSFTGLKHIVKTLPDLARKFQGKILTAPHFLDSLTCQLVSEKQNNEESHLADHTHLNRPQEVVSLVKKAGFNIVKTDWMGHREIIDNPEDFWEIQRTFSSIARKRLNEATPKTIESLKKSFLEKCLKVQSRGGNLQYPFAAFFIVANKIPANQQ